MSKVKKILAYYWNEHDKKIEKLEQINGTPFQKAHQKFLNKHKALARWPFGLVRKMFRDN